jgi:tetratricopeptide (TPR) repeat protein
VVDLAEVDALVRRAFLLRARNEVDQAAALLMQALVDAPDHLMAQTRLAEIEIDRRQHEAATGRLRHVLQCEPHFAPAWAALAQASWLAGKPAEGLRHARRAVAIQPPNPQFRLVLAQLCVWLYRHESLPDLLAPLIADDQPDPMIRARALSLTGEMHVAAGHFAAADPWFRAALALVPELVATRLIYGMNRLRQGDFAAGLVDYEARAQISFFHPSGPPRRPGDPWTGQSLAGKTLLVEDEQGFGDAIHFFRYVRAFRHAGAARVVLKTFPPLVELLRPSAPFVEFVTALPPDLVPDFHCFTSSLPHACGTTLATIPEDGPYLQAPPAGRSHLHLAETGRKRVGLVWSGDPRHLRDHLRSIPAARFLRLADRDDLDFISLQPEVRPADAAALAARSGVLRLDGRLVDFADTAAVIGQLDLVISVDTSVAHLAGALGKPVWLLLPLAADWRWLAERTDSPWYPSMQLFRADRRGWGPVLQRAAAALSRMSGPAGSV